jgi:hypothetical protein
LPVVARGAWRWPGNSRGNIADYENHCINFIFTRGRGDAGI